MNKMKDTCMMVKPIQNAIALHISGLKIGRESNAEISLNLRFNSLRGFVFLVLLRDSKGRLSGSHQIDNKKAIPERSDEAIQGRSYGFESKIVS